MNRSQMAAIRTEMDEYKTTEMHTHQDSRKYSLIYGMITFLFWDFIHVMCRCICVYTCMCVCILNIHNKSVF